MIEVTSYAEWWDRLPDLDRGDHVVMVSRIGKYAGTCKSCGLPLMKNEGGGMMESSCPRCGGRKMS